MAHNVYVEEAEYGGWRWVCAQHGKRGKFVRSKEYAEALGQKHINSTRGPKPQGPKVLRDLLKFD